MLISLNWLKEFINIPENLDPKELATELTIKTAEVDSVINEADAFENIVVGQIVEITAHPNADKLKVTKVSIGKETSQIVCGGSNLREGMYVAIAKPGAKVKWHGAGDLITLERTKIRDVESDGMICAGSEIGIPDPHAKEKEILDLSAMKTEPGTPLSELLQKNDVIFEFDNKALTHRPDLWGHYGIAREIAVLTGAKLKPVKSAVKIPTGGEIISVEVKDEKLCPRYGGLIIENVKVGPSPDWLQKKLKATGHGTHNNIVDVTNYIMLELGQPMHAFDQAKIEKGIVVRKAKKGEKIPCLDDKTRELDEHMLVIADHEKPVAIAGVIGGANSEIGENTTSIILESANFNSSSVRKTSTKFMLRTDAVQRFEKGLDPNLCELAIKRAAELILEICPEAKIAGPITDASNFSTTPLEITLDTEMARSKIGAEISDKQMKDILEKLEFEVQETKSPSSSKKTSDKSNPTSKFFTVTVPTFRANKDVKIEDDIIEEIARIFGYGNIPATLPSLPTRLPQEHTERFKKHRARELLSFGLGFDEVSNYSFYGKNEIERCLLKEEGHVKLLNYLSEDQTHMRVSMTPNLLKNLQHNVKIFDELRIYEIGRVYKEINQFMPLEEKKIVGAILVKGKSDEPFYEAKGVVETIFKKFEIQLPHPAKGLNATPYAHPNKAISYIDQHDQTLGKIFMLHPIVAKNHDLENYSIAIFAINFTELMKLTPRDKKYKKIGRFPSIQFDVSVLVDANIEIQKLKDSIRAAEKHLITDVTLFDIYQGQGIAPDKKAVAFKITLQSEDRTLTDNEMTETQKFVFKNLEELGGVIRGK
jgi:phenylalanyl-tRNA synthetase beta chain